MKNIPYHYLSRLNTETIISILTKQKIGWLSCGICGEPNGNRIKVCYRPGYRNSWNPVFYGMISEHSNGTMITGCFQKPLFTKAFMWIWRSIATLISIIILISIISSSNNFNGADFFLLLIPVMFLVFSVALDRFGTFLGRKSEAEVIKLFEEELLALPVCSKSILKALTTIGG